MSRSRPVQGEIIDGFRLDECIHRGTMSSLWLASFEDQDPGSPADGLVMKFPSLAEGEDVSSIVGFEVEQMILPRLSGPHVPRFIAAGDHEDQPWLVMEHLEGDTLRPLLEQAPLPPAQVAELGALAATAILALHTTSSGSSCR